MATSFTKQEQVMFDKVIEGFDDLLVIAKGAELYDPLTAQEAVNARDKFWIPAPMIGASYDGFDQSANFDGLTQLNVPASVGYHKSVPKVLSSKNLRNTYAMDQFGKAAKQKLASDVNAALFNTAALYGSVVSKRTGNPTGYDDVADLDTRMTRIGVPLDGRKAFYSPSAMNAMAGNLASRSEDTARSRNAYEQALIRHDVAGFEVFKNDQEIRLAAAAGGATTVNGANQRTIPAATITSAGLEENKDNRYTDLVVTSANYAGIKIGDAFTIDGVNELHLISKQNTGQLKTFRVVDKPAANTIRIWPAIIDAAEGTIGSKEYANVSATPASGAALTWLNTATAALNPFFRMESLILIPGSFTVDADDGWQVMRATTDVGIGITYTRQGNINDLSCKARWDIDFGTALLNPEMAGVQLFNQT
ncbi:P22 phage major capsid protein family protein [Acinetobacter junii]|uniref:P22 phage major capsid protein family protein n=1 Tax=Acinetobacter junii TaxID=40215 RepID=UPI00124E980C|nr:P22 phage major capsid protein family protein [Acinetobacter junii]